MASFDARRRPSAAASMSRRSRVPQMPPGPTCWPGRRGSPPGSCRSRAAGRAGRRRRSRRPGCCAEGPIWGLMPMLHAIDLPLRIAAERRAAAEVAGDDLEILATEQFGHPPRDVAVARAVEPPAADAQTGRPVVGDGVALAGLGDRPVEAGLERRDQREGLGTVPGASAWPWCRAGCGPGRRRRTPPSRPAPTRRPDGRRSGCGRGPP